MRRATISFRKSAYEQISQADQALGMSKSACVEQIITESLDSIRACQEFGALAAVDAMGHPWPEERSAVVFRDHIWHDVPFDSLLPGDVFRLFEADGSPVEYGRVYQLDEWRGRTIFATEVIRVDAKWVTADVAIRHVSHAKNDREKMI